MSVSNSLLPTNVDRAIAGRSCTATISTSPCASRRTSRKKPVAYSALIACAGLLVGHAVADLDRQVAEDRAGLGALHALDADVADDERIERLRASDSQRRSATSSSDIETQRILFSR